MTLALAIFLGIIAVPLAIAAIDGWLRRLARTRQDRRNYESLLEKAHRELRREQLTRAPAARYRGAAPSAHRREAIAPEKSHSIEGGYQ